MPHTQHTLPLEELRNRLAVNAFASSNISRFKWNKNINFIGYVCECVSVWIGNTVSYHAKLLWKTASHVTVNP